MKLSAPIFHDSPEQNKKGRSCEGFGEPLAIASACVEIMAKAMMELKKTVKLEYPSAIALISSQCWTHGAGPSGGARLFGRFRECVFTGV